MKLNLQVPSFVVHVSGGCPVMVKVITLLLGVNILKPSINSGMLDMGQLATNIFRALDLYVLSCCKRSAADAAALSYRGLLGVTSSCSEPVAK